MKAKKILVGVSGGVAAYKALDVVSALRKQGHEVTVCMTASAAAFITPLSFAAVSGNRVISSQWPSDATLADATDLDELFPHLYPATAADVFLVVPATANTIANLAQGRGVDALSTSALSLPKTCRRVFCPSMNVEMWDQDIVQENVLALELHGWERIGPESGHLACGMTGSGRLAEPADIVEAVTRTLRLEGKRVLILSGPTREHMDPVRYIGNPSSGKMGKALAEAARAEGAEVEFISGPVPSPNLPSGASITRVTGAADMLEAARPRFKQADIVLYVAAVADYTPVKRHESKAPKESGKVAIELEATPDIAATLCADKRAKQVCIGFALQTEDGEQHAQRKLKAKNLDAIVLNYTDTLGANDGRFTFIASGADAQDWGRLGKASCAKNILEQAIQLLGSSKPKA